MATVGAPIADDYDYHVTERLLLLLEAGARLDATNSAGHTPVIVAARLGNRAAMDCFFVHGAKIPTEALHHACACGQLLMVKYLMTLHGKGGHSFTAASPNSLDGRSTLPVQAAAAAGHCAVVEYLVTVHGAAVDAVDRLGRNALHHAAEGREDNAAAIKAVLALAPAARGGETALVAARDRGGRTALEGALRAGHQRNAALLLAACGSVPAQTPSELWRSHRLTAHR